MPSGQGRNTRPVALRTEPIIHLKSGIKKRVARCPRFFVCMNSGLPCAREELIFRGMNSIESIREELAEQSNRLGAFGIANLWLFGSAARQEETVRDLDFLVEFSMAPGLLDYMELKFFLEDLFGMPIDLHTYGSCPQRFYDRICDELKHVA